jgi:hypothetical protein
LPEGDAASSILVFNASRILGVSALARPFLVQSPADIDARIVKLMREAYAAAQAGA